MQTRKTYFYKSDPLLSANHMRFGIVVSEWNSEITQLLYKNCHETLLNHKAVASNIITKYVPGSFELPLGAQYLAENNKVHAIICLGCIIKGETKHNEYISGAVASGLMQLSLKYSIPFIFGVLTPDNMQQAKERADGKHGNKGAESAIAAIKMIALKSDKN